jgi:nucleoside-diphosphate-sugar epimerase
MATLVTGAYGFIGSWVVRQLVQEGEPVYAMDLSDNARRLRLSMTDEEIAEVHYVHGDVTVSEDVNNTLTRYKIDTILHLAALQVPFCRADPRRGARVNVEGTVNIFQGALETGINRVTYCSSAGVYGPASAYPPGPLAHDAPIIPLTLYGVYKQADENLAKVYWNLDKVASIGVRPYTVYGPGRDQGMTSTPTAAMLAAAKGQDYHISFGGVGQYQYGKDVARAIIQASRTPFAGADCYNLGGSVAHMEEIVQHITAMVPGVHITFNPTPLNLPESLDGSAFEAVVGPIGWTPLNVGIAETIAAFKSLLAAGRLEA